MPHLYRYLILSLTLLSAFAQADSTENPLSVGWEREGKAWMTLESAHVRINYTQDNEDWARYVAKAAEDNHARLSKLLRWEPKQKSEMTLVDDFDFSNGWSKVNTFPSMRLILSPPDSINELESYDDWLYFLISHEYTHNLHLDKRAGAPAAIQKVLGRHPLLFPAQFQPNFLTEGLATWAETDTSRRIGRGQSSFYAMKMRMEVKRGLLDLNQMTLPSSEYPYSPAYLYGVYLIDYLDKQYGREKLQAYLDAYSRNLVPFWLNPTARRIYGKRFPLLWEEMRTALKQRFQPELDAISVVAGEGFAEPGSLLPLQARGGYVYTVRANRRQPMVLQRWLTGSKQAPETLAKLEQIEHFDVDGKGRVLIAQLTERADQRVYSDLYLLDKGSLKKLTEGARYREARWLPDGQIVARKIERGFSELVLLNPEGKLQRSLWKGQAGEVLGQFSIAPKGDKLVAMHKAPNQDWHLSELDLSSLKMHSLLDAQGAMGSPSYSPDGKSIVFSADFGGRYDIRQLDLESGTVTTLTRVDGGAFHPAITEDGRLYYQRFDTQGFQPHYLQQTLAEPTVLQAATVRPARVLPDVAINTPKPYTPLSSIYPRYWYPVLGVNSDNVTYGITTHGSDALEQHQYQIALAGNNLAHTPLGMLSYLYSNRYQISAERSLSFYQATQNGKTETQQINAKDHVELNRYKLFNMLDDKLSMEAALIGERTRQVYLQPGTTAVNSGNASLAMAGAAIHFNNVEQYTESIAPVWGRDIQIGAATENIGNASYRGHIRGFDWKEYLSYGSYQQAFSLRVLGLQGEGAQSLPIALGGNDDAFEPARNFFIKSRYPLRGYRENIVSGTSVGLATLEWHTPLARVNRGWNIYPLGVRNISGTLFTEAGKAWGVAPRARGETLASIGTELNVQSVLMHGFALNFKLGVARGLHDQWGETRAYLRIGGEL